MTDDTAAMGVSPEQLATLSHEFRTPLNGVLGMARLLESTRLTAEQRDYVAALKESGDHLLALVNDVLDLARLGAGKIELHPAPMDVESLLRQVCELMSPRAHEKGIEIAWATSGCSAPIRADEARLRQILLNFAGNAVKFTSVGGVLLTAEGLDGGRLRFTVSDSGPGVPEAVRAHIFEAFTHADPSHGAATVGGAGLGLAIARRLSDAMGGEIGVGGAVGVGADFWFEAAFPAVAPAAVAQPLAGLTVGIASPNAVVREAAARQVEACGGKAIAADTKAELLRQAPDDAVLLLDHALHAGKGAPRVPAGRRAIVLLRPEERDRIARYRASGFSGYLIKPLRRSSLAARIAAALQTGAAPETEAMEDERIAPAAAPGRRILLAEDNPINALLARALLEREGCHVDRVASGEEALAALQAGTYDLVLMDVRMPGMTGIEAAKALRARGVTTPVAALTADAFEDDRKACLDAGMDDFLVKPLNPDALRGVLARWTGGAVWTPAPGRAKVASVA